MITMCQDTQLLVCVCVYTCECVRGKIGVVGEEGIEKYLNCSN